MKQIQPITIWHNGQQKTANTINMYIVNDDLKSSAVFYYALLDVETITPEEGEPYEQKTQLAQGNLTMSGDDYATWGDNGNINDEAYIFASKQLNLELL